MAEYGNPDKPEEWDFLKTFSPYHNVRRTASIRGHSSRLRRATTASTPATPARWWPRCWKWATTCCYYENIEGGHGGAADNKQAAFMDALAYTFLWKQLK